MWTWPWCSGIPRTSQKPRTNRPPIPVPALVAADLGVSTLPALCLRAARHPGIRTVPLPGAHRYVLAVRYGDPPDPPAVTVLMEALRTVAVDVNVLPG